MDSDSDSDSLCTGFERYDSDMHSHDSYTGNHIGRQLLMAMAMGATKAPFAGTRPSLQQMTVRELVAPSIHTSTKSVTGKVYPSRETGNAF